MTLVRDLTGQRFGKLVVLERGVGLPKFDGTTAVAWVVQCDCGSEPYQIRTTNLKGCKNTPGAKGCSECKNKCLPGMGRHPLTSIWTNMKRRCYEESAVGYKNYGGRGITVCDEWLEDRAAFAVWALANGWAEDLTLDRIDNALPYSPGNCKWSDAVEQNNNRRNNVVIEFRGEKLTATQVYRKYGTGEVPYFRFLERLRYEWSPEEALTKPVKQLKRKSK